MFWKSFPAYCSPIATTVSNDGVSNEKEKKTLLSNSKTRREIRWLEIRAADVCKRNSFRIFQLIIQETFWHLMGFDNIAEERGG